MISIELKNLVGAFAENKDIAREVRISTILPALNNNNDVIIDFSGIESATQSFIHALISELIRQHGSEVLDKISFKNANETVRKIISIVVDYMQQGD